ncbi:MAG: hypothetical protein HYV27_21480 [Candidatus Hydrogenedentes bacterium]|nr:hypothetical protein [Candidatus Hydrogenedentota bacterium]
MSTRRPNRPKRTLPWQRRIRRWVWAFALLVCAPLLALLIVRAVLADRVRDRQARLQALGYATQEALPESVQEDAALSSPFVTASEALKVLPHDRRSILPFIGYESPHIARPAGMTGEEIQLARQVVTDNTSAMALLDAAARSTDGLPALSIYTARDFYRAVMHELVNHLRLDLCLALQDGNTERLYAGLETALYLLRFENAQNRLDWMEGEIANLAAPLLGISLAARTLSEAQLAQLDAILAEINLDASMRASMDAAIARGQRLDSPFIGLRGSVMELTGMMDHQRAASLDLLCVTAECVRDHAPLQWYPQLGPALDAHLNRGNDRLTNYLTHTTAGTLRNQLQRTLNIRWWIEVMRCAIAIERHRLAHGTLPPSLDVLAPGLLDHVPLNPVGGQPLEYSTAGEAFTLASTKLPFPARYGRNQWIYEVSKSAFDPELRKREGQVVKPAGGRERAGRSLARELQRRREDRGAAASNPL